MKISKKILAVLLAAAMLWEERREHKKDERPH